ncbi:hypothetical protein TGDOM2_398660 [Toxoplasma gondii GAB2-2007-GAL-DOM2]|uniref:Uncharacterized protein n=1 Tax=Toxoplasma gondii GAB2-2007-GAL-DOM2 TaxID=1130820 RepID=A0A086KGK2_TOXGO|nr:hypothetical protein TGDOM2_398660 [Toxoplasma gondii GAB2-2007-GAL-DOM2]
MRVCVLRCRFSVFPPRRLICWCSLFQTATTRPPFSRQHSADSPGLQEATRGAWNSGSPCRKRFISLLTFSHETRQTVSTNCIMKELVDGFIFISMYLSVSPALQK